LGFRRRGLLLISSGADDPVVAFGRSAPVSNRNFGMGGSGWETTRGRPTSSASGGGWGGRRREGRVCSANSIAMATIATLPTPLQ
jgi:hypothetical protein